MSSQISKAKNAEELKQFMEKGCDLMHQGKSIVQVFYAESIGESARVRFEGDIHKEWVWIDNIEIIEEDWSDRDLDRAIDAKMGNI